MPEIDLLATCWTTAGATHPLTEDERSPEPVVKRLRLARQSGFTGFGLLHADLMVIRDTMGYPEFAKLLTEHQVRALEIEMLVDWWTVGMRREQSDAMRRDLLVAAASLGARHIKVGGDYTNSNPPLDLLVREFRVLCEQAADAGARIAFEPMPFANLRTPHDALRLIEATNHPAAGMIIDTWHVARAGVDYQSLQTLPRETITSIELDDLDEEVNGTLLEDTINNRRLCGQGVIDLPGFIRAIRQTGYDGPWGVEILSHEHRRTPIEYSIPAAFATAYAQFDTALVGAGQ